LWAMVLKFSLMVVTGVVQFCACTAEPIKQMPSSRRKIVLVFMVKSRFGVGGEELTEIGNGSFHEGGAFTAAQAKPFELSCRAIV
jgi:hypothetical protein